MFRRLVEVSLPKLALNVVSDLQGILSDMGLPALLGAGADFSQLSPKGNFTVGTVSVPSAKLATITQERFSQFQRNTIFKTHFTYEQDTKITVH